MVALALLLWLGRGPRAGAEDHTDYKYEIYAEDADRILVHTHSVLFEQRLANWLTLEGNYVYDGISGATPTGGPPRAGSDQVPMAVINDIRRAGYVEPKFRFGRHKFAPQVAYSLEDDYQSLGVGLNYVGDFNQNNTTLHLGIAHNFDQVWGGNLRNRRQRKDATDFLAGVTQVLTPTTLFNLTLTIGTARGYLSDPYKGFRFTLFPDPNALFEEKRPGHRTKQIVSTTLTQFFEPVNGSGELTYRLYHDSHGLFGHTITFEWFQNVGRSIVISPLFRYYEQSAADFYLLSFPTDPSDLGNPYLRPAPKHFSSDYRLAALRSFTYGIGATARARKWLMVDFAYKRYEMHRADRFTPVSNFPRAHIGTVGLRILF